MNGLDIIRNELTAKYGLNQPVMGELKRISELARQAAPLSVARADAHMLTGLAHLQACHFGEALPEIEAAVACYSACQGAESRETAIATWALAHACAYNVFFDVADELYENAVQMFCFGGHQELMLACLADYEHFLSGYARDEASARAVQIFLEVAAAA